MYIYICTIIMYIDRSGSQIAALHLSLSFECNAAQFVSAGHIFMYTHASF